MDCNMIKPNIVQGGTSLQFGGVWSPTVWGVCLFRINGYFKGLTPSLESVAYNPASTTDVSIPVNQCSITKLNDFQIQVNAPSVGEENKNGTVTISLANS